MIIQSVSPFTGRSFRRSMPTRLTAAPPASAERDNEAFASVQDANPALARFLRPQSAFQWWTLPYLSALTPQYVQTILIGALSGNHVPAWQLFDLMIDTNPEIAACIGEYIDGILEKNLIIEPYHEEDEQPSKNAIRNQKIVSAALRNMRPDPANDENAIEGTIRDILFARFHGQCILEEDWFDTFGNGQLNTIDLPDIGTIAAPRSTFWVHPVCYAYDVTGRVGLRLPPEVLKQQSQAAKGQKAGAMQDSSGNSVASPWNGFTGPGRPDAISDFPRNQFLIAISKAKTGTALGGSALRSLAWPWVVSNFAGDWLLDLAQIFGIPFRKAKYKQGTPEGAKAEVREMLQNMGSRGWCLLDERVDVEFEKAMESGSNSPQGFLMEWCQQQFRKVILRQTMTGRDSSTGKGFGATEQSVKDQCLSAGAKFACSVLREQMARHILINNVNDDSELPFIRLSEKEEGTVDDATRDTTLAAGGLKIGAKYLRKKYGIPEPGEDEETIGGEPPAAPTGAPGSTAVSEGNPKKKDPELEASDQAEESAGKGCLMATVPESISKKAVAWGQENIKDSDLDPTEGREDEPHVTVYYGFDLDFDTTRLSPILAHIRPPHLSLGLINRFECPDYDVLKVDVDSIDMENLHRLIGKFEDDGVTPSNYTYHPHLTLAYVKKGACKELDGNKAFEGEAFTTDTFLYSLPNKEGRKVLKSTATLRDKLSASSGQTAENAPTENFQEKALQQYSMAFAEDVQHVLDRLAKILEISDDAIFKTKLEQFLKDFPTLKNDVLADPAAARALQPIIATALANGLARQSNVEAAVPFMAGDTAGHEFHGNQYTESIGQINDVLAGKKDEATYAEVSTDTAAKIKEATGKDVTGYKHFIDRDALIHIHKEHGVGKETRENQEAVTKDDIEKIPHIVAEPDQVMHGVTARGLDAVKYSKKYSGTTYYVEEIWSKEKVLAAKTMYKIKAPGNSATPEGGGSHTSKTSGAKQK